MGILVACAITALTPAFALPIVMAVLLGGWWLLLNTAYATALGATSRSEGRAGGPNRKRLDHHVAVQSLLVTGLGVAVGIIGAVDHGIWLTDSGPLSVCFASLAVLAFAVFASSLVDWYYIRPRLDGVVREPPCRSSRDRVWLTVTRRWLRHRAIAELVSVFAIIVAATALGVAALLGRQHPSLQVLGIIAAPVFATLVTLRQRAIHTLRDFAIDEPRLWLGDLLHDASGGMSYLLHVSVRSIVVRAWNPERCAWEDPDDVSLEDLRDKQYKRSAFEGCVAKCSMINPQCEWQQTNHSAGPPRRRVIL